MQKKKIKSLILDFKRKKQDKALLIIILLLVAIGLIMILSASAPSALAEKGDSYWYIKKQAGAFVLGFIAMYICSIMNWRIVSKAWPLIYAISVAGIFLVLVPGLGIEANGAKRWIKLGFNIQVSEVTKLGVILSLVGYYGSKMFKEKAASWWWASAVPMIMVIIPVLLVYKVQNHLSAAVLILLIGMVIICFSGVSMKQIFKVGGLGALIGACGYLLLEKIKGGSSTSFRGERIEAWLNPRAFSRGVGYQTMQSLYAIGSGGLLGVGLGKSTQKYLHIPEAHNDFIFAVIAEELGFVGAMVIILAFVFLIWRCIYNSVNATEKEDTLTGMGIATMIAAQVILNIAVVTNTMPNTGISLPFISYGSSSLIILMASMGIMLSISRKSGLYAKETIKK